MLHPPSYLLKSTLKTPTLTNLCPLIIQKRKKTLSEMNVAKGYPSEISPLQTLATTFYPAPYWVVWGHGLGLLSNFVSLRGQDVTRDRRLNGISGRRARVLFVPSEAEVGTSGSSLLSQEVSHVFVFEFSGI